MAIIPADYEIAGYCNYLPFLTLVGSIFEERTIKTIIHYGKAKE